MDKSVLRFINRLYKDLYRSPEVLHHSTNSDSNKFKNIDLYMKNLDEIHERASLNENRIKILKRMYYKE